MSRYWVIAPFSSAETNLFDRVWQFDLSNGHISYTALPLEAATSTLVEELSRKALSLSTEERFGRVFVYHNGAESYYAARGSRGSLQV